MTKATKVYREWARKLARDALVAMNKEVPIPDRQLAVLVLRANFDHLATQEDVKERILESIDRIVSFMKSEGHEIERPKSNDIAAWIREYTKKEEGEDIERYLDRVSLFFLRIISLFTTINIAEYTKEDIGLEKIGFGKDVSFF